MVLARLERSRGRHGELLATMFASGPERFQGLKAILVGPSGPLGGGARVAVENAWLHQDRLVLKLEGVNSITEAEQLRGVEVCVPIEERAPLEPGEVYLSDLVGCVLTGPDGQAAGTVTGWQETPGAPILLEARQPGGGEFLVPFVSAICKRVDTEAKVIEVELPEGLLDINRS